MMIKTNCGLRIVFPFFFELLELPYLVAEAFPPWIGKSTTTTYVTGIVDYNHFNLLLPFAQPLKYVLRTLCLRHPSLEWADH